MMRVLLSVAITLLGLIIYSAKAEVLTIESRVTGNQEQPKVLYIVPWRSPLGPDGLQRDIDRHIQKSFSHVDRDEFRRQLRLIQQWQNNNPEWKSFRSKALPVQLTTDSSK